MAVRIRLARHGRIHRPFYRVVVIDGRCHREGKVNEVLGTFDPLIEGGMKVDSEKLAGWVARGAQVSEGLTSLLKHNGVALPAAKTVRKPKGKKPAAAKPGKKGEKQPWVAPSRRALRAHAAKLKAERKIKTEAEVAAAKAAKEAAAPAAEAPKA